MWERDIWGDAHVPIRMMQRDLAKVYERRMPLPLSWLGEGSDAPDWDQMSWPGSVTTERISAGMYEYTGAFGSREADDRHLQATATGWKSSREAVYESISPEMNDNVRPSASPACEVPVDGFGL